MRTPAQVRNKNNNKKIKGSLSTHSDLSIVFVFDAIGILIENTPQIHRMGQIDAPVGIG